MGISKTIRSKKIQKYYKFLDEIHKKKSGGGEAIIRIDWCNNYYRRKKNNVQKS